jgi:hypothetical protein
MRSFNLRGARVRGNGGSDNTDPLFYVFSVVCLQQIRCVNVISRFPGVITFGVSLPFDEVL